MKLSEILLFITLIFVSWFGINKAELSKKQSELIIIQGERIKFYEAYPLCSCAKLEFEYTLLTNKAKK